MLKFEEIEQKLRPWERPNEKNAKWPPWRHQFPNFKIWEKRTSQISVRSFVENFIKIDPSVWAAALPHTDTHTDTQTDTQHTTHTHTYTLSSTATYSVKMTKYKKHVYVSLWANLQQPPVLGLHAKYYRTFFDVIPSFRSTELFWCTVVFILFDIQWIFLVRFVRFDSQC